MTERHVLTIGTFDMFHEGHYNLLKFCQELQYPSSRPITIGVNSDEFVRDYKGNWPHNPIRSRRAAVLAFGSVEINCDAGFSLIRRWASKWFGPKFIVVGSDWARKDYYAQVGMTPDEFDVCKINLVYYPFPLGMSSTLLKAEYEARKAV